ncbi:MAG: hypothetical protein CM15mP103_06390 [Gammaproteobacteria bacterium]|nr:MAG: hypothetical protein CM15mP103_06390 [Gammaproteobacteria bacterium]
MADGLSRHAALQQSPVTIRVPQFWPELCAADVLTMEYVEGHRAASLAIAALPQATRDELGKAMLQLFFAEVFDLGLVQTDPNFGNYLINDDGSELTLLDFGSVFELDQTVRTALCDTIVAGLITARYASNARWWRWAASNRTPVRVQRQRLKPSSATC